MPVINAYVIRLQEYEVTHGNNSDDFGSGVAVVSDNSSDDVCEDPADGPTSASN